MRPKRVRLFEKAGENVRRMEQLFLSIFILIWMAIVAAGCVHYPINQPIKELHPNAGYRAAQVKDPQNSDQMLLFLTFSGGGTRAASLSYGVLEELRKTEVVVAGKKRRLLDEVDGISGVSGGSFTAGYYGLFGDRIFEDFESKFLKKNIQGALLLGVLNPLNWPKLFSGTFGRSDLSVEYYDKHIFERRTFGDMAARKGPVIVINATDMSYGTRIGFTQDAFDLICSDLSPFPVARAAAASSAVPMVLSPITLRNYAGTCGYKIPEGFEEMLKGRAVSERHFYLVNNLSVYLDSKKKRYIHLVDGGVSDNLGLRAILDRVMLRGSVWAAIKGTPLEKVQKIVLIVVNAETEPDKKWDRIEKIPPFGAMSSAYSSIAIERYNEETLALLKESVRSWTDEIKNKRCEGGVVSSEPGSCGDINFYVVEVKFDALKDEKERMYFKRFPTSFKLSPERVDQLRDVAHRLLGESEEFQKLLRDLK